MEKVQVENRSVGAAAAVIAGATVDGKPNYITLGSYGGLSINPPTVYISINKAHYTNAGIKENGYYSVNMPNADVVAETDYVGIVSGKDTDKSDVFTSFYGKVDKAPMAEECPVNILVKLTDVYDLEKNEIFIGTIEEVYVGKEFMVDGKPDVSLIKPLVLAGGNYCEVGKSVGTTRQVGKALIKEK